LKGFVEPGAAVAGIVTITAGELVIFTAAEEGITAKAEAAFNPIKAGAAVDKVMIFAAVYPIVAKAAEDAVVPLIAKDLI